MINKKHTLSYLIRFTLTTVGVIFLTTACTNISKNENTDPNPSIEKKIRNGDLTSAGEFPYVGAVYLDGQFSCNATLLSSTHWLTSAHCVTSRNERNVTLEATRFELRIELDPVVPLSVEDITVHPDYDSWFVSTWDRDIAIIETAESVSVPEGPYYLIADGNHLPAQEEELIAVGFGNDGTAGSAGTQRKGTVVYEGLGAHENNTLKVTPTSDDNQIICSGDSGGPLLKRVQNNWVILGVASYVSGGWNCRSFRSAYYANVVQARDWILDITSPPITAQFSFTRTDTLFNHFSVTVTSNVDLDDYAIVVEDSQGEIVSENWLFSRIDESSVEIYNDDSLLRAAKYGYYQIRVQETSEQDPPHYSPWFLVAAPGDVNLDGSFDSADASVLVRNLFKEFLRAPWENGDFNGDHYCDVSDFNLAIQTRLYGKGPYAVHPDPTF